MQNVEFLGYKTYPDDLYLIGIATIRITAQIGPNRTTKFVLRFKHSKNKSGDGTFWIGPSYGVTEVGEKKYINAIVCDSRSDEDELMDFIRDSIAALKTAPYAQQATVYGTTGTGTKPTSMDELAHGGGAEAPLPF